jgi:hypothetical protein
MRNIIGLFLALLYQTTLALALCPDGYFELTLCKNTNFQGCTVIKTNAGCCYPMPAPFVTDLNSARGWLDTCDFYTGANCQGQRQCIDEAGYRDMRFKPAYRSYFCQNGGPPRCP